MHYEHMEDVLLHTYIHTYIHRYSKFTIIVTLVFGACSGSPQITFACLSIHPSVREGHQKWYVLEKQEAVPSSSWHLEAKLDLQLGLFHILSMVFKKCMITIDQSAVCTIIIIIMCHELVCHIKLQLWTIIAQPCDWYPSCILSYKHYTM